jgi:hypothetical protein
MKQRFMLTIGVAALTVLGLPQVRAKTTPEKAALLKSTLTPLGAERAGNKDGSIPAWDGGLTAAAGDKAAASLMADRALFSITQQNMAQYADKLSEGVQTMLQKYPETFRLDVYATRRTAAAPQKVYEGTLRNATRCMLLDGGGETGPIPDAKNCDGGIPYPIPNDGAEVMWNHLLGWLGHASHYRFSFHLLTADGKLVMIGKTSAYNVQPNYDSLDGESRPWNGDYQYFSNDFVGPPTRVGEAQAFRGNIDIAKSRGWLYFPGQRRTRQLPNPCCDTPNPAALGQVTMDEISVFNGTLARYGWKLVGKRELYVPYNNNRFLQVPSEKELVRGRNLNPDWMRWELHRVWVVEAQLRPGQRNQVPRARFYLDEDTWQGLLADRYDARGALWKMDGNFLIAAPEVPVVYAPSYYAYDLISGSLLIAGSYVGVKNPITFVDRKKASDALFTPEALAAEGIR